MTPTDADAPEPSGPADRLAPELRADLDAHALWLKSAGREGRRLERAGLDLNAAALAGADLRRAGLPGLLARGADLRKAQLDGAGLDGADLREADLSGADLRGADLCGARLQGARLHGARLRDAHLRDADLTDATGLLADHCGGADVAGAKLPTPPAAFDGLANVAEVSKSAQTVFASILFVCGYTWLTVASTTDAQLLNNAAPAASRLPILGIDLPLVRFYMVAPVLLVCLYAYFHLTLQRLWEELADLPAVFPDGRTLDKKAYPWLLNVLVRTQLPRLAPARTHLARWQARFAAAVAWGVVPATLAVTWARYLRGHDWSVTGLHVALVAAAAGVAVSSYRLATSTLRGSERRAFHWRRAWADARLAGAAVVVAVGGAFYLFSLGVIDGVNAASVYDEALARRLEGRLALYDVRRWLPAALGRLGLSTSAVIDDAQLSTKPPNWSPANEALLDAVRGADLERRDLRHAMGFNAFGVNAYLQESDLRWCDLREADLRRADFRRARLAGANFRFARLRGADFRRADLAEARLRDADCAGARFQGANLRGANLSEAELRGADLSEADLTGAMLNQARLGPRPGVAAEPGAEPVPATPSRLARARLVGADLSGADLTGADLTGADLRQAVLTNARLDGANLTGARLDGANLAGASGLDRPPPAGAAPSASSLPGALAR